MGSSFPFVDTNHQVWLLIAATRTSLLSWRPVFTLANLTGKNYHPPSTNEESELERVK